MLKLVPNDKVTTFSAATIFFVGIAAVGYVCSLFSLNAYRITISNIGTQKIWVSNFKLYDSGESSTVPGGELTLGQKMGSGPYDKKPFRRITIEWKVLETGEMTSQAVAVELPERFTDYRSGIIFYIDPGKKRVHVAYDLHDDAKGTDLIVDAKGNPFDINQTLRQIRQS